MDKEWYKATVRGYDRANKLHNIWYFYDEEVHFFSINSNSLIQRRGQVQPLNTQGLSATRLNLQSAQLSQYLSTKLGSYYFLLRYVL